LEASRVTAQKISNLYRGFPMMEGLPAKIGVPKRFANL